MAFPLPVLVICELLGVPYADRERFRTWSDAAADMSDESRSMSGLAALWQYMLELVEHKRREPGRDVLSDLLAEHTESPDAVQQVAQLGAALLFAGHETTVATIDKGAVLLLCDPGRWHALRRDPALLPGAVEEILRLPLPVPQPGVEERAASGLPRWAGADLDIAGTTVRAGELVLLDLQDANLDDQRFPVPAQFNAARSENPHLAFGHGPHYCIGAPLARIELQSVFAALIPRFPRLRLAAPVEHLRMRSERLTGGLLELPVTW